LEYLGVDERMILKEVLKNVGRVMDRIDLAQDRDRWQALVKVAIKFQGT
jgi:hypothetical protein